MKLKALRETVKSTLAKKMNIKQSLSVMNIPKQQFLDKGDLIMLVDDKNETIAMEWLRDGYYHVDLKTPNDHSIINEVLKNTSARLFETKNFDSGFDVDYVIDYMELSTETKKKIRTIVREAEEIFHKRYSKFGNGVDRKTWLRSIQLQNGNFTQWCEEREYGNDRIRCIKEAYKVAEETNDHLLKRRAAFAKCFIKVSEKRKEN
jgi:hypothetical protein